MASHPSNSCFSELIAVGTEDYLNIEVSIYHIHSYNIDYTIYIMTAIYNFLFD